MSERDPQRRLAAILSADAVGYSRLMAEDEAGTIRTLSAYRHEISGLVGDHGGRVVDAPGDNLLAEFPNALDAVQCAAEIQGVLRVRNQSLAENRRMLFRIGLHLGDIRTEGDHIYGDGVNIAARLEGLAEPGGICISRNVYDLIHGKLALAYDDLGDQTVKNIPDPVRAYRINLEAVPQPTEQKRQPTVRRWAAGAGALLLLLGIAVAIWRNLEPAPGGPPAAPSIAVLLFENLGRDPANDAFTEGIHHDILTQLSKNRALKVIARTSIERLDPSLSIAEIGRKLGVSMVLEGGVQQAAGRVRINVQLTDCATQAHLWAETYDRELTAANIFAIQSDIAMTVAGALRAALTMEEQERVATIPTQNLAAYQSYLLGKQRLAKRSVVGLAEAVDYFRQATELDPSFALAHVGLADSYVLQVEYYSSTDLQAEEMLAKAQAAAEKALDLDHQLGEAYNSLGGIKEQKRDFQDAETMYQRALELNPNYAMAYHSYGALLSSYLDRHEEALLLHKKAIELDPLSAIIMGNVADDLHALGRFEEALSWYENAIGLEPGMARNHAFLGLHHWTVLGKLDEALVSITRSISLEPGDGDFVAVLGMLFLDLGDVEEAEYWIERSQELGRDWPDLGVGLLHLYRSDGVALDYARKALADFPNSRRPMVVETPPGGWIPLLLLRNHEINAGRYAEARALYERVHPELLSDHGPSMGWSNWKAAVDLASVLLETGEKERAHLLLNRSLRYIQTRPRLGMAGYGWADAEIFALQGEKRKALSALRQAIDEGWRRFWWYYMKRDPNLESLHDEPEFQAMVEEIEADMAAQLARVREMERRGELPVIPELDAAAN